LLEPVKCPTEADQMWAETTEIVTVSRQIDYFYSKIY